MSKLVDKAMLEKLALAIHAKAKEMVATEKEERVATDTEHSTAIQQLQKEMKDLLGEGEGGEDAGLIAELNKLIEDEIKALKEGMEQADGLLDGRIEALEGVITGEEGTTFGAVIESVTANTAAIEKLNGDGDGSVKKAVANEEEARKAEVKVERERIDAIVTEQGAQDGLIAANAAAIEAEVEAARAAEGALDARIKVFEEGTNSVAKQIENAVAPINEDIEDHEERMVDVEGFVAAQPAIDAEQDRRLGVLEGFVGKDVNGEEPATGLFLEVDQAKAAADKAQGEVDAVELRVNALEEFKDAHSHEEMEQNIENLQAAVEAEVKKDGNRDVAIAAAKKAIEDAQKEVNEDFEERVAANEAKLAGLEKETVKAEIEAAQAAAEKHADDAITALVDSAPEAMNTLKELAKAINDNKDVYDGYVAEHATAMANMKTELQAEIDADVKVVSDELAKQKDAAQEGTLAKKIADEAARAKAEEERIVGLVEAEADKAREEEGKLQDQIDDLVEVDEDFEGRIATLESLAGIGGEEGKDNFAVLEEAINAVEEKADNAQAEIDALELFVKGQAAAEGQDKVEGLVDRIAALEGANEEGGAVASAIKAAQDAADQAQREVDAVEGRMDTAEGEIDTLQAFVEGHEHKTMEDAIKANADAIEAEVKDGGARDLAIEAALASYSDTEAVKGMLGNVVQSLGLAIADNKLQLTLGGEGTVVVIKEVELEMADESDIDAIIAKLV